MSDTNRTGSLEPCTRVDGSKYYRGRIRLADGSRPRVDVPAKYGYSEERARLYIHARQEREDETHELLNAKRERERMTKTAPDGETCDDYFARLAVARAAEGVRDVRKEKTIWSKWLSPRIGAKPVAAVTRDDVERVRDALDDQVRERIKSGLGHGISGDTAENVWSVLRVTFKESVGARDRALRVRTDDPTTGHKPPLKTPERTKTFIYPAEMTRVLACERIPLAWREAYAVAVYSYVRPEELQALVWADVDFDAGVLNVSKSIDARTGKPKPVPKTANAVRSVPIEATLRPLLVAMHAREGKGAESKPVLAVLATLNDKFRAKQLREHLRAAGVTRARLFAETATLRQVDFRSCRDSGITWLALAKVQLATMQRRAGHTDIATTLGYVKMAEDLTGTIGAPFPPLPASLLGPSSGPSDVQLRGIIVPEEGVEPPT